MAILTPDKIKTVTIGNKTLAIREKIIPDSARATKYVAPYVHQGQPIKPCAKLNNGNGPKAITIHNTGNIAVPSGTTEAEQYTRATWPNCNMGGVVVHCYVDKTGAIWQNLDFGEQGWHAADGQNRRTDHRGDKTGGNLDTIAIECIGGDSKAEEITAILAAWLCQTYGFDPAKDIYTHNYWMYGADSVVQGAAKNCPLYILPRWSGFLKQVQSYYSGQDSGPDNGSGSAETDDGSTLYRVQVGAFSLKSNAEKLMSELKSKGYSAFISSTDLHRVQMGAFSVKNNAERLAGELRAKGYSAIIK